MTSFAKCVEELEKRIAKRAEALKEIYIPNHFPTKPVEYILIGSEP